MDPKRQVSLLPFFTTECAVVVHSRPTLGAQSMFAWIRRIGKTGASPPREALLNQGLSLAMQWGDDWLKPIQGRLAQRFPVLSRDQLDELNSTCQAAMKFGHGAVYDLAEKYGKDTKREEFARVMSETYPWINEKNLSQLFSQGMYYAWKDLGFA